MIGGAHARITSAVAVLDPAQCLFEGTGAHVQDDERLDLRFATPRHKPGEITDQPDRP